MQLQALILKAFVFSILLCNYYDLFNWAYMRIKKIKHAFFRLKEYLS